MVTERGEATAMRALLAARPMGCVISVAVTVNVPSTAPKKMMWFGLVLSTSDSRKRSRTAAKLPRSDQAIGCAEFAWDGDAAVDGCGAKSKYLFPSVGKHSVIALHHRSCRGLVF